MDMPMDSAVPGWLTPLAWVYIALCLLGVVVIATDIYVRRRRQLTVATELVWISSALYLGPVAVAAYLRSGRVDHAVDNSSAAAPAHTRVRLIDLLPGGGASAVAHLIAVPMVAALGWTIGGMAMWPMILVIAVLAIVMVAIHERFASGDPRSGRAVQTSVGDAMVIALITVVAFDIGMVGWMLVLHANGLMPGVTEGSFWFLMQLGVVAGLITAYPAISWLLRREGRTHEQALTSQSA